MTKKTSLNFIFWGVKGKLKRDFAQRVYKTPNVKVAYVLVPPEQIPKELKMLESDGNEEYETRQIAA